MTRPVSVVVQGYKELRDKLTHFERKVSVRIARLTMGVGLRVAQRAMQSALPKNLKQSIGVRNGKTTKAIYEAKVGVNVGRRGGSTKFKRWAPLVVLGSKFRTRKRIGGRFAYIRNPTEQQLSTGQVAAHPIMGAFMAAQGKIASAQQRTFDKAVAKETAKAKLNK